MKISKIIILSFILSNLVLFYTTPIVYSFPLQPYPWFYFILRAFLIFISVLLLVLYYQKSSIQTKSKEVKALFSIFFVFAFLFYTVELFFTFYPETNGKNDTYTSKNWMYYYWRINKQGFRDIDFDDLSFSTKPSIVFTGDSYTEGHGIKDPKDRVSDLVRATFPQYTVYNADKCGWDIHDELAIIRKMPIRPKYLFLQIYSNDWDYLVPKLSSKTKGNSVLLAESGVFWSKYSVLFNYLSSKLSLISDKIFSYKLTKSDKSTLVKEFKLNLQTDDLPSNPYKALDYCLGNSTLSEDSIQAALFRIYSNFDMNLKVMTDTVLFEEYLNKLTEIKSICTERGINLTVIPYPSLDKFSMSVTAKYTNNYLCNIISKRDINTLNIYPALKQAHLNSYTVNRIDNHINVKASKIVADTIISYLKQNMDSQK